MRVFISWSGLASHSLARYLRTWLPLVIQAAEPFVSTEDIAKGSNWNARLSGELSLADVGMIVVTRENMASPWLLFEAGALSKALSSTSVCPLLLDVSPDDVRDSPLSQFQCTTIDLEDVRRLVSSILTSTGQTSINQDRLNRTVNAFYPELAAEVENALAVGASDSNSHDTVVEGPVLRFFNENYVSNSHRFSSAFMNAQTLDISGFGHNRMTVAYSEELRSLLGRGGRLRVLAMDPSGPAVLMANQRSSAPKDPEDVRHQHRAATANLHSIAGALTGGQFELRVIEAMPPFTAYVFDADSSDAQAFIWFWSWRQASSWRPGFCVTKSEDPLWFARFASQFDGMWATATEVASR